MTLFNEQFNELVKVTLSGKQKLNNSTYDDENLQVMDESAKSQDFFHDNNNTIGKNTLQRALNLETFYLNIAYAGISKEDYFQWEFCVRPILARYQKSKSILLGWEACR